MAKYPSRSLITPEFRMSFPSLLESKAYKDQKTGKVSDNKSFQVEAIFDEAALDKFLLWDDETKKYCPVSLPQLLMQIANEAWPNPTNPMTGEAETLKQMFERQSKGWPVIRGDLRAAKLMQRGKKGEHYEGKRIINFKSLDGGDVRPPDLSVATGPNTKRDLSRAKPEDVAVIKSAFSGGNYAIAAVTFQAREVSKVNYIVPYLNGIRYTREGARLGGQSEMDRFDGYQGGASDHDPTNGLDDEIPF